MDAKTMMRIPPSTTMAKSTPMSSFVARSSLGRADQPPGCRHEYARQFYRKLLPRCSLWTMRLERLHTMPPTASISANHPPQRQPGALYLARRPHDTVSEADQRTPLKANPMFAQIASPARLTAASKSAAATSTACGTSAESWAARVQAVIEKAGYNVSVEGFDEWANWPKTSYFCAVITEAA